MEEGGGCRRSAADENRTLGSSGTDASPVEVLWGVVAGDTRWGCCCGDSGGGGDLWRQSDGLAAEARDGKPDMTAPATPKGAAAPPTDSRGIPGRAFMPLVLAPAGK